MTPTKTLYLSYVVADKYIVDKDGVFLAVKEGNIKNLLLQVEEDVFTLEPLTDWEQLPENFQTKKVADEPVTFTFGGYTFERDSGTYKVSEIPPDFEGTGLLQSHNFGVDEVFLCDKTNNVVWGRIGGQKMYFEQSAVGKFSTSNIKPQTAAEMGAPAFEASQNTSFMLAGYVFINEEANSYASSPVPPTR